MLLGIKCCCIIVLKFYLFQVILWYFLLMHIFLETKPKWDGWFYMRCDKSVTSCQFVLIIDFWIASPWEECRLSILIFETFEGKKMKSPVPPHPIILVTVSLDFPSGLWKDHCLLPSSFYVGAKKWNAARLLWIKVLNNDLVVKTILTTIYASICFNHHICQFCNYETLSVC